MIRQLTPQDHGDFLHLMTQLHDHPPNSDPAAFSALLSHPGTTLWGALCNDTVAATATLHLLPNLTYGGRPYGLIENVVTLPEVRGQGLGARVMQAATDHAFAHNAYKVMLLSAQARNARAFYERLGFSADEKHGLIKRAP